MGMEKLIDFAKIKKKMEKNTPQQINMEQNHRGLVQIIFLGKNG